MQYYNHTTIKIKADGATLLVVKGITTAIKQYDVENGYFNIDSAITQGQYILQFMKDGQVLKQDYMIIKQNILYAPNNYDFRSEAEKTLEAINARLNGQASKQELRIKVGDKEIQYSSFDQLIKWKNYYQKIVDKQQGKKASIRHEKLYYKG